MSDDKVVYVIAAAAPPVLEIDQLVAMLRDQGWKVCLVLTPTAATWVNVTELERTTGALIRVNPRLPQEQDPLPPASAVLGAPLTFNVINKWALGINDTLALGLLNELLGVDIPIAAAPCAKAALRSHPAYVGNVRTLESVGVQFLDPDLIARRRDDGLLTFDWAGVVSQLNSARRRETNASRAATDRAAADFPWVTVELAEAVLRQALPYGSTFLRALIDEGGTATVAQLRARTASEDLQRMALTLNKSWQKVSRGQQVEKAPRLSQGRPDPNNPRKQAVYDYVMPVALIPVFDEALRRLGR